MTSPAPGAPNWVDLATADLDGAKQFYTRLFGWTTDVSDGYTTFLLNGLPVAGAGPLAGDSQPTAWSTYLATDDADAVAARVTGAGGKVLVAPFDVMEQGRLAAFLDPAGAPFSVWQPGTVGGAAVFDVPGALTWNELNTRDIEGSAIFYASVFGWTFRESSMDGRSYVVAELNGTAIAGIQPMVGDQWGDLPPHWMVYFAVHDCDRAAATVSGLGGTVLQPPRGIAIGRYAVVADPSGGVFSLLAGNPA
jgi:predicted enzyme related to lactoylglutathione lyase